MCGKCSAAASTSYFIYSFFGHALSLWRASFGQCWLFLCLSDSSCLCSWLVFAWFAVLVSRKISNFNKSNSIWAHTHARTRTLTHTLATCDSNMSLFLSLAKYLHSLVVWAWAQSQALDLALSLAHYLPCLFVWLAGRVSVRTCVCVHICNCICVFDCHQFDTHTLTLTHTPGIEPAQAELFLKGNIRWALRLNFIVYFVWYHEGTNIHPHVCQCVCVCYVFQVLQQLAQLCVSHM